jgi:hypothetical protein
VEDLNLAIRARIAGFRHVSVPDVKCSWQTDTPNRVKSPISTLASIRNWELALSIAPDSCKPLIGKNIAFYRLCFLWEAMRELDAHGLAWLEKTKQAFKWMLNKV